MTIYFLIFLQLQSSASTSLVFFLYHKVATATDTNNHIHQGGTMLLSSPYRMPFFQGACLWPDGLQGLLCPQQNGFESIEDPHQVWEKVTRILNIIFNAYHGSLCQSVLYVCFLRSDELSSVSKHTRDLEGKHASHVVEKSHRN